MADRPPYPGRLASISHPRVNNGEAIHYAEFAGEPHSPDWNFDLHSGRISRVVIIRTPAGYLDLIAAKMLFLGGPLGPPNSNAKYIERVLPHSLPVRSTLSNANGNYDSRYLWCTEFKQGHGEGFRGVDPQWDLNKWNSHVVTLVYSTPPYKIVPDADLGGNPEGTNWQRHVSKQAKPELSYLSMPRSTLYRYEPAIADTATNRGIRQIPFGVGRVQSSEAVKIVWHEVPEVNIASTVVNPGIPNDPSFGVNWIDRALGKVNQDPWNGYRPRTLLFHALEFEGPYMSALGTRVYNCHFTLSFKKETHQTIYWPPLQNPSALNSAPNFVPESGYRGWILIRAGLDVSLRQNPTGGREDGVFLYDEFPLERIFWPVIV